MRSLKPVFSSAVVVALCSLLTAGCGGSPASDDSPDTHGPQSGGLGGKPGEAVTFSEASSDDADAPGAAAGRPGKIAICHIPPGNPANAHTLWVSESAWPAHSRHGDVQGACEGGEEPGGEEPGGEEPGGEEPGGEEPDGGATTCSPIGEICGEELSCCLGLTCGADGICEPTIG